MSHSPDEWHCPKIYMVKRVAIQTSDNRQMNINEYQMGENFVRWMTMISDCSHESAANDMSDKQLSNEWEQSAEWQFESHLSQNNNCHMI